MIELHRDLFPLFVFLREFGGVLLDEALHSKMKAVDFHSPSFEFR